MTTHIDDCDVFIAGGGLVGANLALMLAQLGLRVTMAEAVAPGAAQQPSFDDRSTALANGSRRIFEALGVWRLMEREATPIKRIHVSDQGRFGFARLDAAEQRLNALGYVALNRVMGAALWRRLAEERIALLCPARVTALSLHDDARLVTVAVANGAAMQIRARLVVAADGARSATREQAGVAATNWDYGQTAIVTNVGTQQFHGHVAYERFTEQGPLAMLPLTEGRVGVVWTVATAQASEYLRIPDEQFLQRLQHAFGFRLGRILRLGQRASYPLELTRSEEHIAQRLAVIGNAAQGLHPIAGQGFNLGLRDAASLAEVLADARTADASFDPGDARLLQRYREWRGEDRRRIVAFTDGLVRVFTQPFAPVRLLRDLGMLMFDINPLAKSALSQLSLGAAGRIPRLARGAPL